MPMQSRLKTDGLRAVFIVRVVLFRSETRAKILELSVFVV
jgi:hypothetical protein